MVRNIAGSVHKALMGVKNIAGSVQRGIHTGRQIVGAIHDIPVIGKHIMEASSRIIPGYGKIKRTINTIDTIANRIGQAADRGLSTFDNDGSINKRRGAELVENIAKKYRKR